MKHVIVTFIISLLCVGALHGKVGNYASLADYCYPKNTAKTVSRPAFTPDGATYLEIANEGKRIVRHDSRTGAETETVMDVANTRDSHIDRVLSFILSPEGSKLLVCTASEPIYRRSQRGSWWVYDIRTRQLHALSEQHAMQRDPIFSPDGRMVAFGAPDNNIYIKKIDFDTEVAVTTDGAVGRVINGVADWVYEEEFSTTCSMAWAPDNQTLCYLKYNEADVPAFSFTLYEGTCHPKTQYALYPGRFAYKYPVAGEPNSIVTLHSYDVDNRKTKDLPLSDPRIEYIPRIAYGGESADRLMVVTLNREQTRMEVYAVNPRSGVMKSVLTEEDNAWLTPATYEQIAFESDDFTVLSARSGWTHAYIYSYAGALTRQLTEGTYDVVAYYGADAKGNRYVRTTSTGSINRVVSRIDPKGAVKHLSPEKGTSSAWFAPGMGLYAITHSTAQTPPTVELYAADKKVRTLEDNASLKSRYASAPTREFTTVTTREGVEMNAYIIKPAGMEPGKRYPLIINQYSGPGSQEVADVWRPDWTLWAAQQGFGVLCVDPRGTGFKGRKWETCVYKDLGHYETIDLQGAARQAAMLPWVDPARIGITGWSYGGYETLMAVTSGSDASAFACAVAIAPVTDWRFYDTVYAERYMLTPKQNATGYASSAPLTHAQNLDIPLLIMHGTADDNVHLVNTMQYASVLEHSGKFCDLFLYPNMNHSINGCNSRLNVYSKMMDYFIKNL